MDRADFPSCPGSALPPGPTGEPATLDLENSVLVLLTKLSNMISATGQATFRKRHGLGSAEWKVLSVVAGRPGSSGAEIAQFLSIDRGLVSRTVQALARRDLVRIDRTGRQGNYQAVSLTREGAQLHREALVTALQREQRIVADIDVAARNTMIDGLKTMLDNMAGVAALNGSVSPGTIDLKGLDHLR